MTTTTAPATVELDDSIFDAANYRELQTRVPESDGYRAEKITIRFVGVCDLDRTSSDDLAFVDALRLGKPVRLIVNGRVSGKGFSHTLKADDDESVGYYCAVRIGEVEVGEAG